MVISRSSSSSFGSSLIRLSSLGTGSPVFERLGDATRDPVHRGALVMERPQFIGHWRCRAGLRRGLREGLAALARPPEPLAALEALLELFDANPDVNQEELLDEERGQDRT